MIGRTIRSLTEVLAKRNRQQFVNNFNSHWLNDVEERVEFNLISLSGSKQFADLLYSVASFYRNVGKPNRWIIFNDGSFNQEEIELLVSIKGIQVHDIKPNAENLPLYYYKNFPTLLKVEILSQLKDYSLPILFTDSDIIFYKQFKNFNHQFASKNWYIIDEGKGYFDTSFNLSENEQPLNFGFLVLNDPADWNFIFSYLKKRIETDQLDYWSDQTAAHILAQKEHFSKMPIESFVVGGKDSFKLFHAFDYNKIALRHFVGPVRHKMWQYSWKKVLGFY